MIYAAWERNKKTGTPPRAPAISLARDSGPEQPPHEDRGQDGRGRGRRPLEKRLDGVVFDPPLIGYVYEPLDHVLGNEVGYRGCQYGYEPLLHRIVHTLPSACFGLLWSVPTTGCAKTPRVAFAPYSEFFADGSPCIRVQPLMHGAAR